MPEDDGNLTVLHSRDGGPWEPCDVNPQSIVGRLVLAGPLGGVYADAHGNRYKWEARGG